MPERFSGFARPTRGLAILTVALVAGSALAQGNKPAPAGAKAVTAAPTAAPKASAPKSAKPLKPGETATEASNQELLDDFSHYVYIAQTELAGACAQALLDRQLAPTEFVGVVEDSPDLQKRFDGAYRQAMQVPELEDVASRLNKLYEQGRLDVARNPDEITRNIELLKGNPRARMLASERLKKAGEYAAPQLLETLVARGNQGLEVQIEQLFAEMGGNSVMPLVAALPGVDDPTKVRLAMVLGQTQHAAALPYLYDLMRTSQSADVRDACERAITAITGASPDPNISVAELYWNLGDKYYKGSRSLISFPGEDHQLLWTYNPGVGLFPTAIRTEVYADARAMQLAETAMRIDPRHEGAISLWIAANFKREIDQPQGYDNPVYPAQRPGALYYAVMAGSGPTQRVLARALDDGRTLLSRRAIEALSLTLGDVGLWAGQAGRKPLLDALSYPDRRVQYDAALALAHAKPTAGFPGSERVTPILAGAVRHAAERFAIVLTADAQRQQGLHDLIGQHGFTVLQAGPSLNDLAAAIAEAPGIDLIVSDLSTASSLELLEAARNHPKLRAAPLLAMLPAEGWSELSPRYDGDNLTDIARHGLSNEQLGARVDQLVLRGAGPAVTPEEAKSYAVQALDALRDLAVSRNEVIRVADVTAPLTGALADSQGEVRLKVADVLSRINQKRAQTALMDAALKSAGAERVDLLAKVADSARSFGNQLEARHVRELTKMASAGSGEEAIAAAALIGALNLPETQLAPLIVGEGTK